MVLLFSYMVTPLFGARWCCYVMLHADQDGEKLQALLRLLTELMERVRVVEALSSVPQMYCLAVVEVVRRKMFMRHYKEVSKIFYFLAKFALNQKNTMNSCSLGYMCSVTTYAFCQNIVFLAFSIFHLLSSSSCMDRTL